MDELFGLVKYESWPPKNKGLQVGVSYGVRAFIEEIGLEVIVNIGRSQHINKTIAEEMILTALTHPKFRW